MSELPPLNVMVWQRLAVPTVKSTGPVDWSTTVHNDTVLQADQAPYWQEVRVPLPVQAVIEQLLALVHAPPVVVQFL